MILDPETFQYVLALDLTAESPLVVSHRGGVWFVDLFLYDDQWEEHEHQIVILFDRFQAEVYAYNVIPNINTGHFLYV